jgi:HEAT repeat protein
MPRTFPALAALLALACSCSSSASKEPDKPQEPDKFTPIQVPDPDPLGKFLADLDLRVRAWTNLTLRATDQKQHRQARDLAAQLQLMTSKRLDELIAALESGPPRNRQRAAAAMGFSGEERALGPLVAALEDSDLDVVHNSLLGLAVLALPQTPTAPIAVLMTDHADAAIRSNAAYALRVVVEAGADPVPLLPAVRMGLVDQEPGVRLQAALLAGLAVDGESVQRLIDLLQDDEALVQLAALEALVLIGQGSGPDKGEVARALVAAWVDAKDPMRERLREGMARIAVKDYGQDEGQWVEWSRKLP